MKTKPFDMQAALNGAPVVTRDGRRVRNVRYAAYPVAVDIECIGGEYIETFTLDGRELLSEESNNDLFILDEEGGEE